MGVTVHDGLQAVATSNVAPTQSATLGESRIPSSVATVLYSFSFSQSFTSIGASDSEDTRAQPSPSQRSPNQDNPFQPAQTQVFWLMPVSSLPFLHLKCAKWNTVAEKAEPRKWGHGPLLAASLHPQNHLRGCT